MTQHGKYGDTPLGKSDEELREEGADALTNDERLARDHGGREAEAPVVMPIIMNTQPGTVAPGLVVTSADLDEKKRNDI
ncbi:hypothetical protein DKM44_04755 [Deinococcus irradiatisoli]|uniref:Uncharacterized protein n=1 Tax=Deinococcus irradiatisoli TaxID=2202254 RepID=A0A2Z3JF58_9DEIO|nr:hypothetical protein [Deinococcus irradiatisoli]AWN22626.1 hypothetical protein DKM44_04755 [Deinococcus irradiatisoli]